MSKLKIFGKTNPVVGVKEYYSINDFFENSDAVQFADPQLKIPSNDQIIWSIWVLVGSSWIKKTGNNKTGATVNYTFSQGSLTRKGIRMLVDVNGEKAVLDIKSQKTSQHKILRVELLDNNYNTPTRPFAYGDWIIARVHSVDMERFPLTVTLWEDDGDKTKQNTTNVKIEQKKGNVLNGKTDVSFYLDPSHVWLANAKLAPGDKDEGEFHEYYVTAEIFEKVSKRVPSLSANVPNPDYKPDGPAITKSPNPELSKQTPAEQKGPSKKDQKGIAKSDKKVEDYHEQKIAVKMVSWNDPFIEQMNNMLTVNIGGDLWNKKHKDGVCDNCISAVRVDQLTRIFTKTDPAVLELVAAVYTKYMEELSMNTCWNKAHFFAQAVVESGKELSVSGKGESMNYLAEELHLGRWNDKKTKRNLILSYFATHREEAYKYGRIEEIRNGKKTITQHANEEMIAKLAYGPNAAKGRELGNTQPNDGVYFKGRGLVQLTGRAGYEYANKYTKREGADIVEDPDLVVKNVVIAVLSSMAFFKWKRINKIANEEIETKFISRKVGKDVNLANGKKNHTEKQEVFTKNTAIVFEISSCKYGENEAATDLKIQQGIKWLTSIAIDQDLAGDSSNYKVLYSQDGDRTSLKGEDVMDCSELVCRYLQKIEWSSKVISLNTSDLYSFAQNHSKWLEKHDSTAYKPKVGDIFIWKNDAGSNGHTGVVINFNKTTDIVTTIESINSLERPENMDYSIQLQGVVKLKWKRMSKHLMSHPIRTSTYTASTCRFYTPKVHYSKQDKK